MEITQLSFIDLIRNVALAFFAISTWYIGHEEKRARVLFNASLTTVNRPILTLVEAIIELRDEEGLGNSLGQRLGAPDIVRIRKKINKLKKLDALRVLSVIVFALSALAEVGIFISSWLISLGS